MLYMTSYCYAYANHFYSILKIKNKVIVVQVAISIATVNKLLYHTLRYKARIQSYLLFISEYYLKTECCHS
jgi:hypothetical protein